MTLQEYLAGSAASFPNKIALRCGAERSSYQELARQSDSLASFLLHHGLQRGDRVVIFLENSTQAVVSIFGVLKAGGCFVPLNPTSPSQTLEFVVQHSGAKILISSAAKHEMISRVKLNWTERPQIVLTGASSDDESITRFEEACRTPILPSFPSVVDLDLAAIIYTSGSTGIPKGVTFTHRNIDTVVSSVAQYLEHSNQDVVLGVLQLSFGYGLLQVLVTFRTGGRIVLEKGFGLPYDIINRIREEGVTGLAGVPTLFALLLQLKTLGEEDLSSVRYVTNAAAALPPSFVPRIKHAFPHAKLYLMHGLTECLRTTFLPPDEVERRPTSVGKGMPNVELWLEDERGSRLSTGQVGELFVRGSNVMLGYWNDPVATERVLRPGRYPHERVLRTGDLFRIDEDGFFYFVSRKDEVIKSRGEKVSPVEIENVIYHLEEVSEVRVVGIPDEILGQAIKAEIVLKEGTTLSERSVKAFCKTRLEEYKIPHLVAFVATLPKTSGGKIKRLA